MTGLGNLAKTGVERMEAHTIFNDIVSKLSLGNVISPAKKLTGGFAHEVFSLETDKGKYAIKLLNPKTMSHQKPQAHFGKIFWLCVAYSLSNILMIPLGNIG